MITRRRFFTAVAAAFVAKKLPVPKSAKKAVVKAVPWSTSPVLPVGFIYAPYIPRYREPVKLEDFTARRGIINRYSKSMVEDGKYLYTLVDVI